ncbi:glycosyltransferase family 9 protein [Parafrankia sp. EUN1f]|uniref:glycosyltransferase family 9 protein n=1 Tax=Parafrankia sp. EUN1f TaxID=102897 RepID=UPI0001C43EAC|nr:glycosyltransferase family 9 protein [Parafrankia sp. EUN1f]EFC84523.1 glycosyl transferase family 9 [Parafrankia sp. EUN1f]
MWSPEDRRATSRVEDVRGIVVLRASGLGDLVLALPALDALRAAYPTAHLVYLGLPWHTQLLRGRPGPWDEVDVVPAWPGVTSRATAHPQTGDGQRKAFVQRHRAAGYDLAVQLHGGGAYSTPLLDSLGARITVGGRDIGAPRLDRSLPFRHLQHETLRALEIVGLVGAGPVDLLPSLSVLPSDHCEVVDEMAGLRDARPLVALHPGAGDPRRRWPVDRFAAVADELAREGARVLIVGGREDSVLAARLLAHARSQPSDLTGRLSLPGLVGLLSEVDLMIGNDSGPRHLAAAVGTPTVGIFWCGNVVNAAPLVRARHRVATSFQTTCPDCGASQTRGRCPHNPSFVAEVPVDEVLDEARNLLIRDWEEASESSGHS